ncbi:hypothetical protein GCM10027051_15750 [Niabella terrae]
MADSREKVDSLINVAEANRKDSSVELLYQTAFALINKLHYKQAEPAYYNSYGVFKRDLSFYDASIHYHDTALNLAKKLHNVRQQIIAYNNLGVSYRRKDDYNNALDHLYEARKLAESTGDNYSVTIALNGIGNIHLALENYFAAINYFLECIPIAIKAGNKRGIAINLQNIGECYERLGSIDSAKLYYQTALDYNVKRKDDKGIAICYISLGNILTKEGRPHEALDLFRKALDINFKLGDQIFIANGYNSIGNAYLLMGQNEMAKGKFDTSLSIASRIGSVAETRNAYEGLMKIAQQKQDWERAYAYSVSFKKLSDSVNLRNIRSVRDKEFQYHQNKIDLLETNQKNDRIIMIGGVILFFLLLISGVLFYLRNKLVARNNALQRELEIRSQIASDLHDDMGSSLSSIHIFSELLRKEGPDKQELLTKIEANAKDTLEALDDIIWLVKPSNDKFSDLGVHISEFAIPLFESKNIDFTIDFPEAVSEVPLPMETRRNIFLIIKESVNNLVKYSDCTQASIIAKCKDYQIDFYVEDNGKGFDPEMMTNRNGIKNLKSRAAQINAQIRFDAAPGQGCKIHLCVPVKEFSSPAST